MCSFIQIVGNDAVELSAPLFRLACIRGDTDAKYSYAQLLQAGHGTDADPIEAAKLFTELAQKGHPYAQVTNFRTVVLILLYEMCDTFNLQIQAVELALPSPFLDLH